MMVSRGFSYYVLVVVSAIISMITHITVPDPGKKEAEGSDGQEGLE